CRCRRRDCWPRSINRSRCARRQNRESPHRHSRESGNPGATGLRRPPWAPASAGATREQEKVRMTYMPKELQKVVGTRPIRPDGVDKVTGRANFGADMVMPGMLWGKVKRSPHAHARIMSINTEKARALPGVKAVVTWEDCPRIPSEEAFVGEGPMNFRDLSRNCMARDKVLYDGHAV